MSDAAIAEIKSIGDRITGFGTTLQGLEQKNKELVDKISDIELKMLKLGTGQAALGASVEPGVKSMIDYLRTGVAPEITYDYAGQQEAKAATVSNPPTGGYFAVPDFQSRVLERMFDMSPMRQIAETINITGNLAVLPYEVSPPSGKWVGEKEKRPDSSDVAVGIAQIPVNEYVVKTSISNTLLEDANLVNIESYITNSASRAIDREVSQAFLTGDGHNKPEGLYSSKKLKTIKTGVSKGVTVEMLFKAMEAVPNDALANARWTMSMGTFLEIVKAFGEKSSYFTMPLSQEIPATIFGYPVTFMNAPDITTDGNIVGTFGDHFNAYKIVQRVGLQYQRDELTGADDNLTYTRFRTRVGGQLVMPESVIGIKVGA